MCKTTRNMMESSRWMQWSPGIHTEPNQIIRQSAVTSQQFMPKHIDVIKQFAQFVSTDAQVYTTGLTQCSCEDFLERHLPCSHMYALASCLGVFTLL